MKKGFWLVLFIFVFISDLIAIQMNLDSLKFIFKPLIIISLLAYFITNAKTSPFKPLVITALIFSWAGDVLLMYENKNSLFFILGLSAFLIAHLFYILFFHKLRLQQSIKGKILLLIPVVVFYFTLMYVLEPFLGDLKLPVRVYGIVISFMLVLSLHMLYLKNNNAGKLFALGALLFVMSDTLLAINKFYISFPLAGISIMLTYGLAQFLIIRGSISYFDSNTKT